MIFSAGRKSSGGSYTSYGVRWLTGCLEGFVGSYRFQKGRVFEGINRFARS